MTNRPTADAAERLRTALPASRVSAEESVAALTTYRVGGPAALVVEVGDNTDLTTLVSTAGREGWDVLIVGRGSNLLVSDAGFSGLVIVLGGSFAETRIAGCTVIAGGAAVLPVVARQSAAAGLTGFEWAAGVPGSVGGAVFMNAGGHGSNMAAVVQTVAVIDLTTGVARRLTAPDLEFAYRRSAVTPTDLVISAELSLTPGSRAEAEERIRSIVAWRREHQPGGHNAGSVFTNPPGDSAGRLIDAAGLRGHRVGSAEVSQKHANFIQSDPGGSASDIYELMEQVAQRVHDQAGIDLVPETRLVGFAPWPKKTKEQCS